MLLAMYQKMRLIREKNQATLDLTKFSSKYDRVSKNIEKVQKMYTSKIASLESQAKMMTSQAKSIFQSGLGLTMDGNFTNPTGFGAMNGFVLSCMQGYLQNSKFGFNGNGQFGFINDENAREYTQHNLDSSTLTALYQLYCQGKISAYSMKPVEGDDTLWDIDGQQYSKNDVTAFQALMQCANGEYSQRSMAMNQMNSNYETNVSIWLEAAKAQLEAQQDEAVEPLTYQQTMWELEKEQAEQRLERIKAELENYTRLCSEEAKEQAPKFGL